jgi:hypothetical protein
LSGASKTRTKRKTSRSSPSWWSKRLRVRDGSALLAFHRDASLSTRSGGASKT